jgi:hypothetical protein
MIRIRAIRRTSASSARDEGAILVMVLALVVVGSLFVLPVLSYTQTVLRQNKVVENKTTRSEAVRGGLRVALLDPTSLYSVCANAGPTVSRDLAAPPPAPGLPSMTSKCFKVSDQLLDLPDQQRAALTATLVGSEALIPPPDAPDPAHPELDGTMPAAWCTSKLQDPPVPCGRLYPGNGSAVTNAWLADATSTSEDDKIFLPKLPIAHKEVQPASGYQMPATEEPCQVFFPGIYNDNVTISGPTPTYFVSGIYYFTKTLRITGSAKVVVGVGAEEGCVPADNVAALEAEQAPGVKAPIKKVSGGSGVGGTFVFGQLGRLVIDDSGSGSLSFVMNRRVEETGTPEAELNDVSIMTVNGVTAGPVTSALDIPAQIFVPASVALGSSPEPTVHGYSASTLVSPPVAVPPAMLASCSAIALATPGCPTIDLNFATTRSVEVDIPGYVSVPQGAVSLLTADSAGPGKWVSFGGGMLTAQLSTSATKPAYLQAGILNPVVQKTFKIVTTTTSGTPTVQSTALVQVNATGGYAINSMVVGAVSSSTT